jgi:hypothetical protein
VWQWRLLRAGRGVPSSSVNFIKNENSKILEVVFLRYNCTKYIHVTKTKILNTVFQ